MLRYVSLFPSLVATSGKWEQLGLDNLDTCAQVPAGEGLFLLSVPETNPDKIAALGNIW